MIRRFVDDGSENPFDGPLQAHLDDWIVYHGTSGQHAGSIEVDGLGAGTSVWTPKEATLVRTAFEQLQWHGLRRDRWAAHGYAVLAAWGPDRDYALSGRRHVYLATSFERACKYAHVPGGEISSALRSCLEDLASFAADAALRAEHIARIEAALRKGGFFTASNSPAVPMANLDSPGQVHLSNALRAISLAREPEWIHELLERLHPLEDRLLALEDAHEPVVYAVDVDIALLRGGNYSTSMGIEVTQTIPPSSLLGLVALDPARPKPGIRTTDIEALLAENALWNARMAAAAAR